MFLYSEKSFCVSSWQRSQSGCSTHQVIRTEISFTSWTRNSEFHRHNKWEKCPGGGDKRSSETHEGVWWRKLNKFTTSEVLDSTPSLWRELKGGFRRKSHSKVPLKFETFCYFPTLPSVMTKQSFKLDDTTDEYSRERIRSSLEESTPGDVWRSQLGFTFALNTRAPRLTTREQKHHFSFSYHRK